VGMVLRVHFSWYWYCTTINDLGSSVLQIKNAINEMNHQDETLLGFGSKEESCNHTLVAVEDQDESVDMAKSLLAILQDHNKNEIYTEEELSEILSAMKSDPKLRSKLCAECNLRNIYEVLPTASNPRIVSQLLQLCLYCLENEKEQGLSFEKNSFLVKNLLEILSSVVVVFETDAAIPSLACQMLNFLLDEMAELELSRQFTAQLIRTMKVNLADETYLLHAGKLFLKSFDRSSSTSVSKFCIMLQDLPLRAIALHQHHEEVITAWMSLLAKLTLDEYFKSICMKNEVWSLLCDLRHHNREAKMLDATCLRVTMNLAAGSTERAMILGENKMCEKVVEIMRQFQEDDLLLIVGCDTIVELLLPEGNYITDNKVRFLQCDCLPILIDNMKMNFNHQDENTILLLKLMVATIFLCRPFASAALQEGDMETILQSLTCCIQFTDKSYMKSIIRMTLWLLEDDFARDSCQQCGLFEAARSLFLREEDPVQGDSLVLLLRCLRHIGSTVKGLEVMSTEVVLSCLCKIFVHAVKQQDMDLTKEACVTLRVLCKESHTMNFSCLRDIPPCIVDILTVKKKNMKLADESFKLFRKLNENPRLRKDFQNLGIRTVLKNYNLAKYIMECVLANIPSIVLMVIFAIFSSIAAYMVMFYGWLYFLLFLIFCRFLIVYGL
jgi:hypothetical protein